MPDPAAVRSLVQQARDFVDTYNFPTGWRWLDEERAIALIAGLADAAQSSELERDRLSTQLNTPELHDFAKAVVLEAAHQRERWGSAHDAGKEPQDWFWVVGYLAGKALRSDIDGDDEKALHHTITTAAVLANWHAWILGPRSHAEPLLVSIDLDTRPFKEAIDRTIASVAFTGPLEETKQ